MLLIQASRVEHGSLLLAGNHEEGTRDQCCHQVLSSRSSDLYQPPRCAQNRVLSHS